MKNKFFSRLKHGWQILSRSLIILWYGLIVLITSLRFWGLHVVERIAEQQARSFCEWSSSGSKSFAEVVQAALQIGDEDYRAVGDDKSVTITRFGHQWWSFFGRGSYVVITQVVEGYYSSRGNDSVSVSFFGLPPSPQHICVVRIDRGKVTDTKIEIR